MTNTFNQTVVTRCSCVIDCDKANVAINYLTINEDSTEMSNSTTRQQQDRAGKIKRYGS